MTLNQIFPQIIKMIKANKCLSSLMFEACDDNKVSLHNYMIVMHKKQFRFGCSPKELFQPP